MLANAAWHALLGPHADVAVGDGGARRYRSDVSVFAASADGSAEAWQALARLASHGIIVLFRADPIRPPDRWQQIRSGEGDQMVLTGPLKDVPSLPARDLATGRRVVLRHLGHSDVDAMLALVDLTEPGPFLRGTIALGGYVGIFHDDELVAMAGQRIRPPGYCEISAVCTHPAARRRGYASIVTGYVAEAITARGEIPFVHVARSNVTAKLVYEQLGFVDRAPVTFEVLRAPDDLTR